MMTTKRISYCGWCGAEERFSYLDINNMHGKDFFELVTASNTFLSSFGFVLSSTLGGVSFSPPSLTCSRFTLLFLRPLFSFFLFYTLEICL